MTGIPTRGAPPPTRPGARRPMWRTLAGGAVTIEGGLWAKRQATNRDAALPHGYRMLEMAGNFENLRIAARPVHRAVSGPGLHGLGRVQVDRGGRLRARPDPERLAPVAHGDRHRHRRRRPGRRRLPELPLPGGGARPPLDRLRPGPRALLRRATCSRPRSRIIAPPATSACSGSPVASRTTSTRRFGPGKRPGTPGHPEIEMGLTELYRETGERRYLDLAGFFLDQRGHGWLGPGRYNSSAYYQDRVPVREATEVEGHAVRALYLTAGVADVYLETGEAALLDRARPPVGGPGQPQAVRDGRRRLAPPGRGVRPAVRAAERPRLLRDVRGDRQHPVELADAAGHRPGALRRPDRPDAPQRRARRRVARRRAVLLREPARQQRAAEHLGRGGCRRKEWHLVACCPPNVMRLLASLGHYVATRDATGLQVHQYAPARIATQLPIGAPP